MPASVRPFQRSLTRPRGSRRPAAGVSLRTMVPPLFSIASATRAGLRRRNESSAECDEQRVLWWIGQVVEKNFCSRVPPTGERSSLTCSARRNARPDAASSTAMTMMPVRRRGTTPDCMAV